MNTLLVILIFCFVRLTYLKQSLGSLVNAKCNYNNQPIILDLIITFDISPSINSSSFDLAKKALVDITERFNIENLHGDEHFINLNIYYYAKLGKIIDYLIMDNDSIRKTLQKIFNILQSSVKQTATGLGVTLDYLRLKILNEIRGAAPRVLLIFSDGLNDESDAVKAELEAATWKQMNFKVFTIAVSNQINQQHLVKIASNPNNFLFLDNYQQIFDLINQLTVETCNANAFKFV